MPITFNEASYENAVIELFRDELEYEYLYGPDIERKHTKVVLEDVLRERVECINPDADARRHKAEST